MNVTSFWASLGVAAISLSVGGCSAPSSTGRYQLGDNRVIDTATGNVWQYEQISSDQQEFGWRSLGNPATRPFIPVQQTVAPPAVSQADSPSVASQTPDPFPNAADVKQLDQDLSALKASRDEGNLTDDEYGRSRATAFSSFFADINGHGFSFQIAHDELGYLSQLNKEHRLSDKEFQEAKAAILKHLLPQGE